MARSLFVFHIPTFRYNLFLQKRIFTSIRATEVMSFVFVFFAYLTGFKNLLGFLHAFYNCRVTLPNTDAHCD
jgi:hypothetical protein